MFPDPKRVPPSRINKKQIVGHIEPAIVEAAHRRRNKGNVTMQELIAEAINAALAKYNVGPILKAKRERIVRRKNALAKIQTNTAESRNGKRRIAAYYDIADVETLRRFCSEVGMRIEALLLMGLKEIISEREMVAARDAMKKAELETAG